MQSPQMDWDAKNLPELMFSGLLTAKKEEEKCSYLLIWWGDKERDIANTWSNVTEDDKERFANHVEPRCNPVLCHYKFTKESESQKRENSL